MEGQFNKLIKWILAPPELKMEKPFLQATPIKPLNNNKILYEVQKGNDKK